MIQGLAERLQKLRWKFGFSQRQIADRLGVSPSVISAYENGERTPSTEVLLSLSYVYNCSVDYLLGKNSSTPSVFLNAEGLSEKEIKILNELIDTMRNK